MRFPPRPPAPAASAQMRVYPQDIPAANDTVYARQTAFAGLVRGLVTRWETLDFGVSANCFDLDDRIQAWQDPRRHGPSRHP